MAGVKMNLKNKTAIVTGGTKGIGRGIAEALRWQGVSVCVAARHQSEMDKTIKELNQGDQGRAIGFVWDVRDYDQGKALVDYTVRELGALDILGNNARSGIFEKVEDTTPEDFRAVLQTNVVSVFH